MSRILFVGLGDLGSQTLDATMRIPGAHTFMVAGRNLDYLHKRSNVARFSAMQLGITPRVDVAYMDVNHIEQTAETITRFRPDLLFCAVTLLPWFSIKALPQPLYERLYPAMAGPWLPWPLTLVYKLMQAVKQTGLDIKVVNGSYPDVVNAVLGKVGLSPITGIGNLANNIPALTLSLANKLNVPADQITIYLVAAHYVSHHISRIGHPDGAPYSLSVFVKGTDQTHKIQGLPIFDQLPTLFSRSARGAGHLITASSAARVIEGLAGEHDIIAHAPGPNGLPGGYPIQVSAQGVKIALPSSLPLTSAIQINNVGLCFDGIERIDDDGTVHFTTKNMAHLKEVLGYECQRMPLKEVDNWARELQTKFLLLSSPKSARTA